jgi:hypothetical protein
MTNPSGYIATMPRDQEDRVGKIRMWPSLRYVDPFNLQVEDIDPVDIAHHLAIVNRYTGGSPFPVPVAYHSVRVCRASVDVAMIASLPPLAQLAAHRRRLAHLLHDAAEAYLNDLASPVKRKVGMEPYVAAHERAERVIFQRFGLDFALMAETKPADDADFRLEVKSFDTPHLLQPQDRVTEVTWRQAERLFLTTFESIQRAIESLTPVPELQ